MAAIIGALNVNIRKKRVYRPNFVYKTLTDKEMRAKYRFGKEGLQFITDQLEERLRRPTGKVCAMDPAVQGAIDGSHVKITKTGPTEERPFINKKGRASINVMAVCDNKGRFTFINAEWPGSAHDSFVFRASSLLDFLEENIHTLEDGVLLGASGYACSRYMLTPYRVSDTSVKTRFNRAHCRSNVVIEKTFGRWKRRFSVMCKKERKTPAQACREIVACTVLHNIAMLFGEPDVDDGDVDELPLIPYVGGENEFAIRDHIAQAYF